MIDFIFAVRCQLTCKADACGALGKPSRTGAPCSRPGVSRKTLTETCSPSLQVDDPVSWHAANMERNRHHYSLLGFAGSGAVVRPLAAAIPQVPSPRRPPATHAAPLLAPAGGRR